MAKVTAASWDIRSMFCLIMNYYFFQNSFILPYIGSLNGFYL